MTKVASYVALILFLYTSAAIKIFLFPPPYISPTSQTVIGCAIVGGIGGCVYCLRGVYINFCVRGQWDPSWHVWYFIRPIISAVCGAVSFLFLSAGLLVLESAPRPNASELGFYALAFVAGLNVDKFVAKIEEIAQAAWGIEKSRTSTRERMREER